MRNQLLVAAALMCPLAGGQEVGAQPLTPRPVVGPKMPAHVMFSPGMMAPTPHPVRWEYRAVYSANFASLGKEELEAGLNKLGAEGWELVGIDRPAGPGANSFYIFRRPGGPAGAPKADLKPKAGPMPVPPAKAREESRPAIHIYKLKHARANEMADILEKLLPAREFPMRMAVEMRSNQIIVYGPPDALIEFEAILNRLDVPAGDGPAPLPGKKSTPEKKS